jgi:hypothetical protein
MANRANWEVTKLGLHKSGPSTGSTGVDHVANRDWGVKLAVAQLWKGSPVRELEPVEGDLQWITLDTMGLGGRAC